MASSLSTMTRSTTPMKTTNVSPPPQAPNSSSPNPGDNAPAASAAPGGQRDLEGLELAAGDPRSFEYGNLPEVVVVEDEPKRDSPNSSYAKPLSEVPTPQLSRSDIVSQPIPPYGSPPPQLGVNRESYSNAHQAMSIHGPGVETVTPLALLGDQPDTVDCPFCQRRSVTQVKKHPSKSTHITATIMFFTTFCGVLAPYACHWCSHIGHYCENCGRKVAWRGHGADQMQVLGTPEHLREVSRFPAAEPRPRDK